MHAATRAAHIRSRHGGESEDEESVWLALRERVEQTEGVKEPVGELEDASTLNLSWDMLRVRAEVLHRSALDAMPPQFEAARPVAAFKGGAPPPFALPELVTRRRAAEPLSAQKFEGASFNRGPRRRRGFPVLAAALLCVGAVAASFTHHLLANAKQQARIEEVLRGIQTESAQLPESGAAERALVSQAEAPASETLRALMKPRAEPSPQRVFARLPERSHGRATTEESGVQEVQPATEPAPVPESPPPAAPEAERASPEDTPDLSDDPLFDL